eukprot:1151837-Pelagomonas_calceolata.AAC.1
MAPYLPPIHHARTTTSFINFYMNFSFLMNGLAVSRFDWRLSFSCNLDPGVVEQAEQLNYLAKGQIPL